MYRTASILSPRGSTWLARRAVAAARSISASNPHHPMNTEPRAINKAYFAVQQLPNQTVIATISITGEFFIRINMEGEIEERAVSNYLFRQMGRRIIDRSSTSLTWSGVGISLARYMEEMRGDRNSRNMIASRE